MSDEIPFKCCCPVEGCPNRDIMVEWTHEGCGCTFTINSEGILKCRGYDGEGYLYQWRFRCGGYHDFQEGSYQGYIHALKMLLDFAVGDSDVDFVTDLTAKLKKWKKEGKLK